jgi:phosphate transport system permease protein
MTAVAGTELGHDPKVKIEGAKRLTRHDNLFSSATFLCAMVVLIIFAGMFVALGVGAWPAYRTFGLDFITTEVWNPVKERYGILGPILGTLITSTLAMMLAVPVGIGVAIFLTEICPRPLRKPIGIAVELLAGIPSIVYGIWGLFVFAPFFQATLQPFLIAVFANIPILNMIFAGPPYGIGMFTASLILGIMVLPLISSVTRDVFETVPPMLKEAAYGLGSTTWEVIWNVVLPYSRAGVVGGGMLALGRALGETMAVTFVIGNAHRIAPSLFAPGTTISAAIANEFSEATTPLYASALLGAGLFLFVVTFFVLAAAQFMLRQLDKKSGGQKL